VFVIDCNNGHGGGAWFVWVNPNNSALVEVDRCITTVLMLMIID